MSRSSKLAAVVSVVMLALLYAAIERGRGLRASRALHQLPSTARAILHIDAAAIERTPAAKILLEAFVPREQLSEIEATCGLNPLDSLREATVWVRGPDDQPFQSTGLMLRGRTANAATLADCHRVLVERRGGSVVRLDALTGPLLASNDGRSAVALIDDQTIVTGSVRTVAEAVAVRRELVPALADRPHLAALWPKVNRDAGIAAVLDPPEHWKSALENVGKLGEQASALQGLQAIGASIESGSRRTIRVYVDVEDAGLATENAELIRTWASSPPSTVEAPWRDVLRSARVQVREHTLVIALDVSGLSRPP